MKMRTALAVAVSSGVAIGSVGFAQEAGASASACATAPPGLGSYVCMSTDGSGRFVSGGQVRRYKFDGWPGTVCNYQGKMWGNKLGAGTTTWFSSYSGNGVCVNAYPIAAWADVSNINSDFVNKTWIWAQFKEDNAWMPQTPQVCVQLNPWDWC